MVYGQAEQEQQKAIKADHCCTCLPSGVKIMCWNGPNCKFLKSGWCRFEHSLHHDMATRPAAAQDADCHDSPGHKASTALAESMRQLDSRIGILEAANKKLSDTTDLQLKKLDEQAGQLDAFARWQTEARQHFEQLILAGVGKLQVAQRAEEEFDRHRSPVRPSTLQSGLRNAASHNEEPGARAAFGGKEDQTAKETEKVLSNVEQEFCAWEYQARRVAAVDELDSTNVTAVESAHMAHQKLIHMMADQCETSCSMHDDSSSSSSSKKTGELHDTGQVQVEPKTAAWESDPIGEGNNDASEEMKQCEKDEAEIGANASRATSSQAGGVGALMASLGAAIIAANSSAEEQRRSKDVAASSSGPFERTTQENEDNSKDPATDAAQCCDQVPVAAYPEEPTDQPSSSEEEEQPSIHANIKEGYNDAPKTFIDNANQKGTASGTARAHIWSHRCSQCHSLCPEEAYTAKQLSSSGQQKCRWCCNYWHHVSEDTYEKILQSWKELNVAHS